MSLLIRTQQHWLPRSVDALLTIIAWVGFISLIVIGVRDLIGGSMGAISLNLLMGIKPTLETLLVYLITGAVIGAILLMWAKYNEVRARRYERRQGVESLDIERLSASFRVSPAVIEFMQSEQVWIVHNYEYGDLSAIEIPGLGLKLPANADHSRLQSVFSDGQSNKLTLVV
ncbi:poly-beta-1,6-N-acetyl-D-glucosamine biosynthesis protein PgaD [Ectopseudomonas mendocina]|uniref:Poly-beta-1,6-N-acetyl-D-glucosamine biosynthesis protein PgaD n=1 Tax=Ectopseudomonas mendocina TaxID=300 RepID=A0ABZ2RME5_ECTME